MTIQEIINVGETIVKQLCDMSTAPHDACDVAAIKIGNALDELAAKAGEATQQDAKGSLLGGVML